MVCFRNVEEGIFACDVGVIVMEGFEQIFLGAYAVVVGEMIGKNIRRKRF